MDVLPNPWVTVLSMPDTTSADTIRESEAMTRYLSKLAVSDNFQMLRKQARVFANDDRIPMDLRAVGSDMLDLIEDTERLWEGS